MKAIHKRRKFKAPTPKPAPKQSEIQFLIGDGKIVMQFPEPVANASFTVEQAVGLAQILVKLTGEIQKQKENAIK